MLDEGADVNVKTKDGVTALIAAVTQDSSDIVELLLKAGANLDERDREGRTASHRATRSGDGKTRLENIELLLYAGADPNAQDSEGDTPVLLELSRSDAELEPLKALLEGGAELTLANNNGQLPIHKAAARASGDDGNTVALLLERGVTAQVVDKNGLTPLHYAVVATNVGAVKKLLDAGADINVRDKQGYTALDLLNNAKLVGNADGSTSYTLAHAMMELTTDDAKAIRTMKEMLTNDGEE
jgi:ankyrin repeat protein